LISGTSAIFRIGYEIQSRLVVPLWSKTREKRREALRPGGAGAVIQGNTAANGDQTITVTDATHFTLNSSSRNGTYVGGTGTCSGGGMAYYDAYTAQAAQTALGRSLATFYTQDDDPTVNGSADANFLASLNKSHIDSIRTTVLAAYSGAKFELLWPYDVNFSTCYPAPWQ
jgi:hypothetical protein